ncbi:MAG: helix-turn-helix domain-containing protein [Lachnospiraceae bacterium]|nr:helix-turn-helix domain-containing protein [Lachnospiraceae bacterium]
MKINLTISEKLKDLRKEKNLSLEELAEKTGLSRSALGSYEVNDFKDITHTTIIKLAQFYGVSTDYILGLTENREEGLSEIANLRLDDDTIRILKSGTVNNRLLCEIIKHPDFWKLMSDTEIYIDSLAAMQIHNLNSFVALMRSRLQLRDEVPDSDHYIQTLKACEINEDDYFSRLICEDISAIAKDIKENHRRDVETGDDNNPLTEVIDIVKEYAVATDPMKATLTTLSKQLGMNFNKMDPAEVQFFTTLVEKYSSVYRNMLPKKGRGKK